MPTLRQGNEEGARSNRLLVRQWFNAICTASLSFENKELFEQNFPAQFISEAVDQTRGWFYTLLAISTVLFDTNPFENCVVLGHVLDKNGLKMSKHKGNVLIRL